MTDHVAHPADLSGAQKRMFRGSFYLVLVAELMIFVTLFSSRFLLAGTGHPESVNQALGLGVTGLLVISLIPLMMGFSRVRRGEPGAGMLKLAAVLGILALVVIIYDWVTLAEPVGSRYGENYVMSTAYHALHIILGIIGLLVVATFADRGRYRPANYWPVEAATMFWGFVVATWLALFVVFYLL